MRTKQVSDIRRRSGATEVAARKLLLLVNDELEYLHKVQSDPDKVLASVWNAAKVRIDSLTELKTVLDRPSISGVTEWVP